LCVDSIFVDKEWEADAVTYSLHPATPAWLACVRGALIAASVTVVGCSFFRSQVAISSADGCIEKQCRDEQGKARQECMTRCQREYGP
jgi:hypothetical protein